MIYKFLGGPGGLTALRAAAHRIAQGAIYQQLNLQAGAMGYMDTYRVLGWASGILVGFAFLLTKNPAGAGAPAGEVVHQNMSCGTCPLRVGRAFARLFTASRGPSVGRQLDVARVSAADGSL